MLKIDDLRVNYGGIEAVKGITFEVPERKIVTLIGANSAGKAPYRPQRPRQVHPPAIHCGTGEARLGADPPSGGGSDGTFPRQDRI